MSSSISIQPFNSGFGEAFKKLNQEWLETYFEVEPIDEEMLSNPEQYYIQTGGQIFLAVTEAGEAVGSYALIRQSDDVYELSKMAVDPRFRGQQIGHQLLQHALQTTENLGASVLQLYTHSKLETALHLYEKFGFRQIPVGVSQYKRSDLKMEKLLDGKL